MISVGYKVLLCMIEWQAGVYIDNASWNDNSHFQHTEWSEQGHNES